MIKRSEPQAVDDPVMSQLANAASSIPPETRMSLLGMIRPMFGNVHPGVGAGLAAIAAAPQALMTLMRGPGTPTAAQPVPPTEAKTIAPTTAGASAVASPAAVGTPSRGSLLGASPPKPVDSVLSPPTQSFGRRALNFGLEHGKSIGAMGIASKLLSSAGVPMLAGKSGLGASLLTGAPGPIPSLAGATLGQAAMRVPAAYGAMAAGRSAISLGELAYHTARGKPQDWMAGVNATERGITGPGQNLNPLGFDIPGTSPINRAWAATDIPRSATAYTRAAYQTGKSVAQQMSARPLPTQPLGGADAANVNTAQHTLGNRYHPIYNASPSAGGAPWYVRMAPKMLAPTANRLNYQMNY